MAVQIIAPLVTPRQAAGGVDYDGLRQNVGRLGETSLDGYLALGSSGEFPFVPAAERLQVIRTVIEAAGSKYVLAQVGGLSTAESLRLAEQAMAAGASGVLAVVPYYYTPQLRQSLTAYYAALARVAPTYLYHIPQYTGMQLTTEEILQLAAIDGVVGMKDSSGNTGLLVEVLAGRPSGFVYYTGGGSALPAAMAHGAEGTIAALANLVPDLMRRVVTQVEAGDHRQAMELTKPLARLNALTTRRGGIPGLKYAASRLGFQAGEPFEPLGPVAPQVRAEIDALLEEMRGRGLIG